MKASIFLLAACCGFLSATAQFSLSQFNQDRIDYTQKGMYVLGTWGVANVVWGAIGTATTDGSTKHFHQMNLGWGVVNATLAGLNLLQVKKWKKLDYSLAASISEQRKIEKLFLLNAGLDVAYLGTGAWLVQRSKVSSAGKPAQLKGFGNSLLLQGGFLLLFDGIMYSVHTIHGKKLQNQLSKIELTAGLNSLGLRLQL